MVVGAWEIHGTVFVVSSCDSKDFSFFIVRASSRYCEQTTKIGDYVIPEGFQIQMDLESVHMNPEHWGPEDVTQCVPER